MKLEVNVSNRLIISPQLRNAIEILHMSALELKQKIQNEIEENPFLDEDLQATKEQNESMEGIESGNTAERADSYFEDSSDSGYVRKSSENGHSNFIEGVLTRPDTLQDHLIWQLRLSVSQEDLYAVGEMIIGNIDENGWLSVSVEEISGIMNTDSGTVLKVLKIVQGFEPFGVGARDLQECLLIQLSFHSRKDPWAERMLTSCFDLLRVKKYSQIARMLGIPEAVVQKSVQFISTLYPKPGQEYNTRAVQYVVPDVVVKKIADRFVVIINDPWIPRIRMNEYYDNLLHTSFKKDPTRKFLEEKQLSALWLIKSIEQRRLTIYKVANSILKFQAQFFDQGIKYISPLTLRVIADHINMHESTISRVTNNKFIQTPWGTFELKYFFSSKLESDGGDDFSSRSVKEILKDLIENEKEAYSDNELVKKLKDIGVKISRRTVTKYRKLMNILPSYLRKK